MSQPPTNGIGAALRHAFKLPLTSDEDAERITERLTIHEQVRARFEAEQRSLHHNHQAQANRVVGHLKSFINGTSHA